MVEQKIILQNPERFEGDYEISKIKLENTLQKVLDKLESKIPQYKDWFTRGAASDMDPHIYRLIPNNNWVCGMHTGIFYMAYELSGNKKFLDVANGHLKTYRERLNTKTALDDHDVGFAYTPSCVASWKLTQNEDAKKMALEAAEHLYNTCYSQKGGFILRSSKAYNGDRGACRTMMDTLLNIPLFFWAAEQTGDEKYYDAAVSQYKITAKYLIRPDASSYHHYQFDLDNHAPVGGRTYQGYADESTWSRGHAWGVYGFPVAYSYTKDEMLINLHRDVTYFMLNHLPNDLIPYWDYDFVSGNEPRDSSAAVISVCGMLEMCKYLPKDVEWRDLFRTASAKILDSVIDNCSGDIGKPYDGFIYHVTGAKPQGLVIDGCGNYADYFYLEAILRFLKPDWECYWK